MVPIVRVLRPEMYRGAGCTDAQRINAMLADAVNHPSAILDLSGEWEVDEPILLHVSDRIVIAGSFRATAPMDRILEVDGDRLHVQGVFKLYGTGSLFHASRTVVHGAYLERAYECSFGGFYVENTARDAVTTSYENNSHDSVIGCRIGQIRAKNCGSAAGQPNGAAVSFAITGRTDIGGSYLVTQSTELLCTPPAHLEPNDLVVIEGESYHVITVSTDRITVFPWVRDRTLWVENPELETRTVEAAFGAALRIRGSNTASVSVAQVLAQRCGMGLRVDGLYGPVVGALQAEVCGLALVLGNQPGVGTYGTTVSGFHPEACVGDIVRVTRTTPKALVSGLSNLDMGKVRALAPLGSDGGDHKQYSGLGGITLFDGLQTIQQGLNLPRNGAVQPSTVGNAPKHASMKIARSNPSLTVEFDDNLDRLCGLCEFEVLCVSPTGGAPGTVTLTIGPGDPLGVFHTGMTTHSIDASSGPVVLRGWREVPANRWHIFVTPLVSA